MTAATSRPSEESRNSALGSRTKNGTELDAIRSLASFGANCVRLRLFVDPDGRRFVINDLPYTLALGKRAKAAKQAILLDLHYSDTWADPAHQIIPQSWPQDSLEDLAARVESYTIATLRTFEKNAVLLELVQIGNEIDSTPLPALRHFRDH